MYEVIFLFVLALIWVTFAVIQDLRTREIANWLSFSLIIFALGFRFFYSLFGNTGFNFFYQGLIGLGIFYVIGNVLYYGRVFAGGDAKLMISLGTVLPLFNNFFDNIRIFLLFLILFLFAGAVYGFFCSGILSLKNFKNFKKEFYNQLVKNRKRFRLFMVLGLFFMLLGFFENLLFLLGVVVFIFVYFYAYAKAVDESCMIKKLKPSQLTEGDWLYKDIKIKGKIIKASWSGLTKKEIKLIQRTNQKILIRQGIPFSPAFLISFLVLIYFWFFRSGILIYFWG